MPLTQEQQQVIINALQEKLGGRPLLCPISGDSNWRVDDHFARLQATDNPMQGVLAEASYPNVVVICQTCGYTMLVNVFVLGLGEYFGWKRQEVKDARK